MKCSHSPLLLVFIFTCQFVFAVDSAFTDLPPEILKDVPRLIVDRFAPTDDSHMLTLSIFQAVNPRQLYRATLDGFVATSEVPSAPTWPVPSMPMHEVVSGVWTGDKTAHSSSANILGSIDTIYVDTDELVIPGVLATAPKLAYYGAELVKVGDTVAFDADAPLPVTTMNIGAYYGDDYLMSKDYGGGFYLEYHDRPHFHLPLDNHAKGFLVLGKKVSDTQYHLTAFAIPFGYAVHTPGGVIHDDGLLVGNYLVIYSVTNNFRTAVVKGSDHELVHVGVKIQPDWELRSE